MKKGDSAATTELLPVEQFKEFVRRVVSVPKADIERGLAAERRRRAKAPRRSGKAPR